MTEPLTGLNEAVEAAREAVVRGHHAAVRQGIADDGLNLHVPLPYDELSDRTKRLKHQQLDGYADDAVQAAYPVIAAAVRADERAKSEDLRTVVEAQAGALDAMRLDKYRDNPEWLSLNMRYVADKLRDAITEPTP